MQIVEKVRALLAKARDEACSEAEAEACMARARKLMDEHGVSEVFLEDEVGQDEVRPKYLDPWRKTLANRAAAFYGCTTLFFGTEKRFVVVGRGASRSVAMDMIQWLDSVVLRLAREWRKSVGGSRGDQLNFERACGLRIGARLAEMTAAAKRVEAGGGEGGGTSLVPVIVRELEEADEWMRGRYRFGTVQARSKVAGAGGAAGRAAGEKVSLGGQLGGGRGVRLLT